jgi:hypothetical protein
MVWPRIISPLDLHCKAAMHSGSTTLCMEAMCGARYHTLLLGLGLFLPYQWPIRHASGVPSASPLHTASVYGL